VPKPDPKKPDPKKSRPVHKNQPVPSPKPLPEPKPATPPFGAGTDISAWVDWLTEFCLGLTPGEVIDLTAIAVRMTKYDRDKLREIITKNVE
jgi:hypothetical protein